MSRALTSGIGASGLLFAAAGLAGVIALEQGAAGEAESAAPTSSQTQECIECHQDVTPGIVQDWQTSRHSRVTVANALKVPALARRVSSKNVPAALGSVVVGCYECHSLNAARHKDNFEHAGHKINIVVSPADCGTCHADELAQYSRSKKAYALDNLQKNPVYHQLVKTITSPRGPGGAQLGEAEDSKNLTCFACHGTRVEVRGKRKLSSSYGDFEFPELTNWPNQGVGRVNPDGSRGACTSCHPRHSFSIEVARKPFTCAQCHLEPDTPAWEVYRESKHGNIFLSRQQSWNWSSVPWRVGIDFQAPTCATCHVSLIVGAGDQVIAQRSHDFGSRLWVRLFGLPYSHPQPRDGRTYLIKNADGLPLPTSFDGKPASAYLIDAKEQARRREGMQAICRGCHSSSWAQKHFAALATAIVESDRMTSAATQLVQRAWQEKRADKSNPFDESIEQKWVKQWLFYANSVRYAAAMSGPDYAAFKNGWWYLNENLRALRDAVTAPRAGGK